MNLNAQSARAEKEWTFLVFLNGFNDLDSYGLMNMNDMEKVGSSDHVNVVVQWASMKKSTVQRILIQKDSDLQNVTSPVLENLGAVDMGSDEQLLAFLKWGSENFPAKKYFVNVWNHGNGWQRRVYGNRDISYDDLTGNKITTEELGKVIRDFSTYIGKKVDIYGSDACLMSEAEVAAEMKDHVDVYAGSQDLEPAQGWPYSPFLSQWIARPEMNAEEVMILLSKEYVKAYSGGVYGTRQVVFSGFRMSQFVQFENAMADFGRVLQYKAPANMEKVKQAIKSTQAFYWNGYRDIYHFTQQVESLAGHFVEAEALRQAVNELIITNDVTSAYANKAFGISVWLPTSTQALETYLKRYRNFEFDRQTQWSTFLDMVF